MYLPPHFEETRPEVLRELIARYPLATLVTMGPDGLAANHVPMLYEPEDGTPGTIRGHLARSNPQWRNYSPEVEALAVFQGPEAYISPNWYPSKQQHGRVVPTWNYAVVHVYGTLRVFTEPDALRTFLDRLTTRHEAGQPVPWMPADAPSDYIAGLMRGIVGIEMKITRVEGKWKMSQNQPADNREGAAGGLEASGDEQSREVARLIRER